MYKIRQFQKFVVDKIGGLHEFSDSVGTNGPDLTTGVGSCIVFVSFLQLFVGLAQNIFNFSLVVWVFDELGDFRASPIFFKAFFQQILFLFQNTSSSNL